MPAAERVVEVRTSGMPIMVTHVADLAVGERGELWLRDHRGGDIAVFAPGQWIAAFCADDPPEGD